MKKITNNEGRIIEVPADLYNELLKEYAAGTWAVIITVNGCTHSIILPYAF